MALDTDDEARYDQHLGTAAEAAFVEGNQQLATLLVECRITDVTYVDALFALVGDEMSSGVRVYLEAPGYLLTRFSDELIGELQGLLNASLMPEGETVLGITLVSMPSTPGWRDRIVPALNLDDSDSMEN
jgi:hypothetical protein